MNFSRACLTLLCATSLCPVTLAEEELSGLTGYRFFNYLEDEETGELMGLGDSSYTDKLYFRLQDTPEWGSYDVDVDAYIEGTSPTYMILGNFTLAQTDAASREVWGIVTDTAGVIKGAASTTGTSDGKLAFDFSGSTVTLETGSDYILHFADANSASNGFVVGDTLTATTTQLEIASANSGWGAAWDDEYQDWIEVEPGMEEIFFYFYCNSPELAYTVEPNSEQPAPAVDIQAIGVVPEPGTASLGLLALAGWVLRRRRR